MRVDIVNGPGHQQPAARSVELDGSILCSRRAAQAQTYYPVGKQSAGMVRGACVLARVGKPVRSTGWAWGRLWDAWSVCCWCSGC